MDVEMERGVMKGGGKPGGRTVFLLAGIEPAYENKVRSLRCGTFWRKEVFLGTVWQAWVVDSGASSELTGDSGAVGFQVTATGN